MLVFSCNHAVFCLSQPCYTWHLIRLMLRYLRILQRMETALQLLKVRKHIISTEILHKLDATIKIIYSKNPFCVFVYTYLYSCSTFSNLFVVLAGGSSSTDKGSTGAAIKSDGGKGIRRLRIEMVLGLLIIVVLNVILPNF